MKNLVTLIVFALALTTLTSCASTTVVRARPANAVVVTKVHRPKVIVHKNVRYYRADGVWYKKRGRKYVVVNAPVGVKVTTLPRGYRVVKVRGITYYKYKGVYYKRSGRKYIVVNV